MQSSPESTVATGSLRGQRPCRCVTAELPVVPPRVVLTGGPGGGKTAVLEVVRRQFCEHVVVLPEAASLLFGGGFPRGTSESARRAAQRAIFHVQNELERLALDEDRAGLVLCDRGVVDGAAYWPAGGGDLLADVGFSEADALRRYAAVIHLRTPEAGAYDHTNPLRVESATDAAGIDARVATVWSRHPHRVFIDAEADFVQKVARAIEAIERQLPACCKRHDWKRT